MSVAFGETHTSVYLEIDAFDIPVMTKNFFQVGGLNVSAQNFAK